VNVFAVRAANANRANANKHNSGILVSEVRYYFILNLKLMIKAENIFSKYDKKRGVKIPPKSEKLAELFGILTGDGHLIENGRIHRFGITLNLKDDIFYATYVTNLIRELFNLRATIQIREEQGRLDILVHSKAIINFILSLGFPNGTKKDKLNIPTWILKNKNFTKRFLRGIFDTDGSLFFAKRGTYKCNEYPVIEIKIYDEIFMNQVEDALKSLGFGCVRQKNKVQLNGKMWMGKWLKIIGTRNMNQLSRYLVWKKFKYCPPKTNLRERINLLSSGGRKHGPAIWQCASEKSEQNRLQSERVGVQIPSRAFPLKEN